MIEIPFTKLHGAENDFLLTWATDVPEGDRSEIARRICGRNTGIGGDGWMLVEQAANGLATRLYNSDGSDSEISGNGTRCAAAFALYYKLAQGPAVTITTTAGAKKLRLIERQEKTFLFEMNMGEPKVEDLRSKIEAGGRTFDATILNVGNPQCAIFVAELPADWREIGKEVEWNDRFPQRTNVSFVRVAGRNRLEVVFFERGAGETRSSGTGSTGAAVAAILRGESESPIEISTPAGSLHLRWDDELFLTGPAEVIGEGRFFL